MNFLNKFILTHSRIHFIEMLHGLVNVKLHFHYKPGKSTSARPELGADRAGNCLIYLSLRVPAGCEAIFIEIREIASLRSQ